MYKHPPYTPMPSLGHELGIMFGFLGACLVTMALYTAFWRVSQHRTTSQSLHKRKAFHARGGPHAFEESPNQPHAQNQNQTRTRIHTSPLSSDPSLLPHMAATITSSGSQAVHEKMVDRYAVPRGRVELPVHGPGSEYGSGFGSGAGTAAVAGMQTSSQSPGQTDLVYEPQHQRQHQDWGLEFGQNQRGGRI